MMGTTSLPQAWSPIGVRDLRGGEWDATSRHGVVTLYTADAYQAAGLIEVRNRRVGGNREVKEIRAAVRAGARA